MKKLLLALFLISTASTFSVNKKQVVKKPIKQPAKKAVATNKPAGWAPISKEQAEYEWLNLQCNRIVEQYTAMGGSCSSPAMGAAIYKFLKDIGTDTSFRVLEEQRVAGRVR